MYLSTCAHLLSKKSFSDTLRKEGLMPSLQTLCYHAGRSQLSISPSLPCIFCNQIPCGLESEATQCPNPLSYVPRAFTDLTDYVNILQRVKNLIFDIPNYLFCDFVLQPYAKLASEFLQQDVTVPDLLRKASIGLLRLDFVFHYPRPLMPNMIVTGGVNCAHRRLTQVGHA